MTDTITAIDLDTAASLVAGDYDAIDGPVLASVLALAIEDDRVDASVLAEMAAALAGDAEIDSDDDDADDYYPECETVYATSERTLTAHGVKIAKWSRCSAGFYNDDHPNWGRGEWVCDECTDGGDMLPDRVSVVLDAIGLEDDIPGIAEPTLPSTDDSGEWAVVHKNDYSVSTGRDEWEIVAQYETKDDARAACQAKWRAFAAANSKGSYGPEWAVANLGDDGEIAILDGEDE